MNTQFALFIFVNAIVLSTGDSFADFAPYSYTGNYLINGTVTLMQTDGTTVSMPVTTIFDSKNKRIFSGLSTGGGSYVVLANASYVFGIPGAPCLINDGWNYAKEIAAYSEAFHYGSYYKLFTKIEQWQGNVVDQTSCGNLRLASNFETADGILLKQTYVFASPDAATNTCFYQKSILDNHILTYRPNAFIDVDSYFALPASCATPISFCAALFPPGNPCFQL